MKNLFNLLFVVISTLGYSQKSDCSEVKKELQTSKTHSTQLLKEIEYYKETLNLLKPIRTVVVDAMELNIIKIVGSKKDKSLSIIFVYQNKDSETRSFFQCEQAFIVDPQGNQFQTYDVFVTPNNGIRAEKILPSIPIKARITFKTTNPGNPIDAIDPSIPTIKILTLKVYAKNHMDSPYSAIFENIPVTWE